MTLIIIRKIMKIFSNLFGNNSKISSNDIACKLKNNAIELDKLLFFQDGEVYNLPGQGRILCSGCLTSGRAEVLFSITLPKRLDKISSVKIASMHGSIRHADGGYIQPSSGDSFLDLGSISAKISSQDTIECSLSLKSASSYANNSTISVMIREMKISFSK